MDIDKALLEKIIRQVLSEQQKECGVLSFKPLSEAITEAHRLNTGNPAHKVYTKDLMTLEQSPRLGLGVMEMEKTTFDWTLNYDEVDVILEGTLSIVCNGTVKTASKGEILYIPKGSSIQFSVPDYAKFIYVTYPADWQTA